MLAYDVFGANCGPAAFAAALTLDVCDVMAFFDHFPFRDHTDLSDMICALERCCIDHEVAKEVPSFGLLLVQLEGPWTAYGYARRWAGQFTHWVAVSGDDVYDINAGAWMPERVWQEKVLAALIRQTPRATGWTVKRGIAIHPQEFSPESVVPGLNWGHRDGGSPACAGPHCGRAEGRRRPSVGSLS